MHINSYTDRFAISVKIFDFNAVKSLRSSRCYQGHAGNRFFRKFFEGQRLVRIQFRQMIQDKAGIPSARIYWSHFGKIWALQGESQLYLDR